MDVIAVRSCDIFQVQYQIKVLFLCQVSNYLLVVYDQWKRIMFMLFLSGAQFLNPYFVNTPSPTNFGLSVG